jgi:hypothetical protein
MEMVEAMEKAVEVVEALEVVEEESMESMELEAERLPPPLPLVPPLKLEPEALESLRICSPKSST